MSFCSFLPFLLPGWALHLFLTCWMAGATEPRSFAGRGLRARYFASLWGARSRGFLPPLIIMFQPRVWHRFSHKLSEAKLRIIYIIAFRGPEPGVFFLPKISFGGPTTDTHQPLSFCVHCLVQFWGEWAGLILTSANKSLSSGFLYQRDTEDHRLSLSSVIPITLGDLLFRNILNNMSNTDM